MRGVDGRGVCVALHPAVPVLGFAAVKDDGLFSLSGRSAWGAFIRPGSYRLCRSTRRREGAGHD